MLHQTLSAYMLHQTLNVVCSLYYSSPHIQFTSEVFLLHYHYIIFIYKCLKCHYLQHILYYKIDYTTSICVIISSATSVTSYPVKHKNTLLFYFLCIYFFKVVSLFKPHRKTTPLGTTNTFHEGIPQISSLDRFTVCNPVSGGVLQLLQLTSLPHHTAD